MVVWITARRPPSEQTAHARVSATTARACSHIAAAWVAVMLDHVDGVMMRDPSPAGAVLVVGAGASGQQIAEELMRSGRTVYISVGAHNKLPRRYRGYDTIWWMDHAAVEIHRWCGRRRSISEGPDRSPGCPGLALVELNHNH